MARTWRVDQFGRGGKDELWPVARSNCDQFFEWNSHAAARQNFEFGGVQ